MNKYTHTKKLTLTYEKFCFVKMKKSNVAPPPPLLTCEKEFL